MARLSIQALLATWLLLGFLLSKQGLCRPNQEEEEYGEEYPNDDDGNYDDDEKDDGSVAIGVPVLKSKPQKLEVKPGETFTLPCDTENLTTVMDVYSVVWRKDGHVLFVDALPQVKEPRYRRFHTNNSLVISSARSDDMGHYSCEFSSDPAVKLEHEVIIPVPAKIVKIVPPSQLVVEKGSPLTLMCEAKGYPEPTVSWRKKGKQSVGTIPQGNVVVFEAVDRRHSGIYECTATNGEGGPATATVEIRVYYEPEVEAEKTQVNTGSRYESELTCIVHAEPRAKVTWLFKGFPINANSHQNRVQRVHEGNRHTLKITDTRPADFGDYECVANNSMGITRKMIELTGKPSPPEFVNGHHDADDQSNYVVEWTLVSYSPVTEYKVLYRTRKSNDKWTTEAAQVENPEGNVYTLKYMLKGLKPGDYEVALRAKNEHGWTPQSKLHDFSISNMSNGEAAAETSTMEEEKSEASEGGNSGESTKPRILALLTVITLSTFFL